MGSKNILHTAERIVFSRYFLILFLLWLLFIFLLSELSTGSTSSSPINNFSIPDSQVSWEIQHNGNVMTVFAQNFNQYGSGIAGTALYYNISGGAMISGTAMTYITGGYAGKTNSSGFVQFNYTGLQPNYAYFMVMHFFNPNDGFNSTPSPVFQTQSVLSNVTGGIAITPVNSESDPQFFSLHLWAPPELNHENVSVVYIKSPEIYSMFLRIATDNFSGAHLISKVSLATPTNVVTGIPATGKQYFYLVGVELENGSTMGNYLFSTVPTQVREAQQTSSLVFGVSSIIAIVAAVGTVFGLSTPASERKGRLDKLMPPGFPGDGQMARSSMFILRIATSFVVSAVIVAATTLLYCSYSLLHYKAIPGINQLIFPAAGMLLMMLIASSYASILLAVRAVVPVANQSPGFERYRKRIFLVMWILAPLLLYYFYLNSSSGLGPIASTSSVILQNYLNPFAYVYLMLQKVNESVLVGSVYSFNPSSYGLTPVNLIFAGVFWVFLWVVIPYLLFMRFPGSTPETTVET